MTNLDSVLKIRYFILPTKVHLVKAMVFSVVMMDVSWSLKKAEHRKTDAFELWYWRRLLGVPWTARRSSQSILKEISPEHSLEGQMLKLKLWHSGHLLWRTDLLEQTLILGKIKGGRRRGRQDQTVGWHHQLNERGFELGSGSCRWTGRPGVLWSMGSQRVRHDWVTELNWRF